MIAAGTLADGDALTAEYGQRNGGAVEPDGSEVLTDSARDPSWRTLSAGAGGGRGPGPAGGGRRSGVVHGWMAFTAPVVASAVALADYLPRNAPVAHAKISDAGH